MEAYTISEHKYKLKPQSESYLMLQCISAKKTKNWQFS